MLSDSKQWVHEAMPIVRHLRDFEEKVQNPAYCLFIAPSIHEDLWGTCKFSAAMGISNRPQKIVPMTIRHFCDVADFCIDRKLQNQEIKSAAIKNLFDMLVKSVLSGESANAWKQEAPRVIETWKQTA